MVCFGTRPEVIKLAPVIAELASSTGSSPIVVATGAAPRDARPDARTFGITAATSTSHLMRQTRISATLDGARDRRPAAPCSSRTPDAVLVQGDTTTAIAASLAAFYRQVPVGHVEAGLRTGDPSDPFPEEITAA